MVKIGSSSTSGVVEEAPVVDSIDVVSLSVVVSENVLDIGVTVVDSRHLALSVVLKVLKLEFTEEQFV
jgi:hypothetical protein